MDEDVKERLIGSYQTKDTGFIVHTREQLEEIFRASRIDPTSLDHRVFAIESVAHFEQGMLVKLFNRMGITQDDFVLTVGEGNGAPSRLLAKLKGCMITGVDINPDQVDKAKQCAELHGVQDLLGYVIQNAETLDLPNKSYTKAYFNETICHWQNKEEAFLRIYNHLASGAKLGCHLWLRGNTGDLNDAYNQVPSFRGLYKPDIWFQLSLEEISTLFTSTGFRVIEAEDVTDIVHATMQHRLDGMRRARARGPEGYAYLNVMGERNTELGERYYEGMLAVNGDYLRYARLIMEK